MTITNLDESKIRAKDLGLLFAVERALNQYGLQLEIVGSVAEGAKEGRSYRDIDLKVAYDNTSSRYEALCDLVRVASQTSGQSSEVVEESQEVRRMLGAATTLSLDPRMQGMCYINTFIEQRFQIRRGRTTIDLCFEGLPITQTLIKNSKNNFDAYKQPLFKDNPDLYPKPFFNDNPDLYRTSNDENHEVEDKDGKRRAVRRRT